MVFAIAVGMWTFPSLGAAPYMEVNGRVVVEAEHFATNTPAADGHHWHLTPDQDVYPTDYPLCVHPNAHGDKFMSVLPDNNGPNHTSTTSSSTTYWGATPWLDYVVYISTPGTYRLWLRWRGWDGNSDSMYAQILELKDGTGGAIPDWYNYWGNSGSGFNGQWRGNAVAEITSASGTGTNAIWNITTPGKYTIRLTYREDGCAVDKLCFQLTTQANPTDSGPPESPVLQDGPFVWAQSPAPGAANVSPLTAYQVQIRDGSVNALSATDPTFLLNGAPLTFTKSKVGLITTLDAASAGALVSGSTNTLTVNYQDTAAASYSSSWQFIASAPAIIPATFKIPAGQVSTQPGFTVNMHQAQLFNVASNAIIYNVGFPTTTDRAEGQLREYYVNPDTGLPYTNNLTASTGMIWGDGLDDLALPETYVNWNIRPAYAGGTDFGNFIWDITAPDGFGFPDTYPPSFFARTDQMITNNFAAELITYLDLPAGLTRMGINSDDGFRVTCGLNPRERYDTNKVILLGQFEGGRGSADTLFDINVAEAGIYPIRVLWYQGGGDANIEFFHMKPNGTRILVNDIASAPRAGNAETIKAYRSASVPRSAVVDWLQPAPNALNVATNAAIQVQLGDSPDATVNQPSIRLYLNDLQVAPITTYVAPHTTLNYVPAPALASGSTNTGRVEFTDSLGNSITQAWTFVTATAPVTTAQGELMRKLWAEIAGGTIADLTNSAVFTNNVSYNTNGEPTVINSFEQQQFANPAKDLFGQQFLGYIKPEVTDWYTFFLSSDDAGELRLSTNDLPIGLRMIAFQPIYSGNREYVTGRRVYERRSVPIYLESGKRYFVEGLQKDNTGGDNFNVAWWRTNEPAITNGSPPISGPVLEKFVGAAFTKQPASVTTSKGHTITLSAAAYIGTGLVNYQWFKDGGAVPGANALTYVVPYVQPSQSGLYKLRITVDGIPYDSNEATVVVNDDTIPPAVVGTGVGMNDPILALNGGPGYTVAIQFSEELDPLTAATSTITLSDATIFVSERTVGGTGNAFLLLKVSAQLPPSFTMTLSGITDLAQNPLPAGTVVTCSLSTFTPMVLGTPGTDPIDTGGTVAYGLGANGFQVTANGSDIWNTNDAGHFIYTAYTGNFDAQVRVESLTRANDWSKAVLMARESLDSNSRYAGVLTTPLPLNNLYNTQWRDTANTGSGSSPDTALERPRGVAYPNAWIRLIRQGDTFITLINTNNADWYYLNQHKMPAAMPQQLFVGLATTSHDNIMGDLTTAIYRDFQISPYTMQPPNIAGGVTLRSDGNVSFSFTAALWQRYRVLASTDLALPIAQWTVISQGTVNTTQPVVVQDLTATNYPARFYSIVSP